MAYNPVENFKKKSPWTEESTDFVLKGWLQYSATELMSMVKKEFGILVTRNAIIGLVHRNGLMNTKPKRVKPVLTDEELAAKARATEEKKQAKALARAARDAIRRQRAVEAPITSAEVAEVVAAKMRAQFDAADNATLVPDQTPPGIAFADRRMDQCAYPVHGSRNAMLVCGSKVKAGHSYCTHHYFVCTGA